MRSDVQNVSIGDAYIKKKWKNVLEGLSTKHAAVVVTAQLIATVDSTNEPVVDDDGLGAGDRDSVNAVADGWEVVDIMDTTLLSIHALAVTLPFCTVFESPLKVKYIVLSTILYIGCGGYQ